MTNFIIDCHSGASYILAYLKERGIHGLHFIQREPIDLETLTKKIIQQEIRIIGFTCFDNNYYFIKLISQRLKEYSPELVVVLGGPTATFSSELIMQDNPAIDICVRGEGEATAYELIKQLKIKGPLSGIKGITYRINGELARNPDRPFIVSEKKDAELDIIPSPYLSGVIPAGELCGITTSRGCVFKCIYCNFSAMSRWTVRYHSVERVIAELKKIYGNLQNASKAEETVNINDDAFSLNPVRAKQICQRIIEEKINLRFWCDTRADKVDKELLNLMYRAGIRTLNFGLESVSPRVLKTIKKVRGISCQDTGLEPEKRFVEKVKSNVGFARKIGINASVSIILGLPGATKEDDLKTLDFVRRLKVDSYYHNYLNIFAGTELFNTFKEYRLKIIPSRILLPTFTKHAYDTYSIPMLNESYQNMITGNRIRKVIKIINGGYEEAKERNGYPDLLFINYSLNKKTIEWLKETVAICPLIVFANNRTVKNNPGQMMLKEIVVSLYTYPIGRTYLLELTNTPRINYADKYFKSGQYTLIPAKTRLGNTSKGLAELSFFKFFPFANFAKKDFSTVIPENNGKRREVIFSLSTLDDVRELAGLFSNSEKITLDIGKVKSECDFLDACRWSSGECPSAMLSRAIIDKGGSIRTCFNGPAIAKIGDRRENILKNLKLLFEDTKKKRGCLSCPVRLNCSKCLFPHPFTAEEYCQIRRGESPVIKMEAINKAFKLFKLIMMIKFFDKNLRQNRKIKKITALISSNGMNIIDVGRRRYFYHDQVKELSCKNIRCP
ncbi:MAG: radical SAM protein [Candidatus Omnitrophica bacterium]|nr:radical SAM protein [Candidatus Omnitrophota bacterium]